MSPLRSVKRGGRGRSRRGFFTSFLEENGRGSIKRGIWGRVNNMGGHNGREERTQS